jgi:hypothetical protein
MVEIVTRRQIAEQLKIAANPLKTNNILVKAFLKTSFIDGGGFLIHIHGRRPVAGDESSRG